jgi:hypothetical protein
MEEGMCFWPYSLQQTTMVRWCFRAYSHIPCHSAPLPCHSAKGSDCVSRIWFTVWPRFIHTSYHAVPLPCHKYAFLKETSQGHGRVTAWERHGMCELALAFQRQHVGELPAFSFFLLPPTVPGRLSEAYQSQMQVASVKQSNICHGWEEYYYFRARTWALV